MGSKGVTWIVRVGNTVYVAARTAAYDQGEPVVVAELRRTGIDPKSLKNYALVAKRGSTSLLQFPLLLFPVWPRKSVQQSNGSYAVVY